MVFEECAMMVGGSCLHALLFQESSAKAETLPKRTGSRAQFSWCVLIITTQMSLAHDMKCWNMTPTCTYVHASDDFLD